MTMAMVSWRVILCFSCHFFLLLTSVGSTTSLVPVINVDVNFPEQNREVKVVPFTDVNKDGILHNGFDIMMDCDIRDFIAGSYKAELISSSKVLISLPSTSHTYLHDFGAFFEELKKTPEDFCDRAELGHGVARNAIIGGDKARQTKKLMLCFPEHIVLVMNQHYCKSKMELKSHIVPFKTKFDWNGNKLVRFHDVVFWKVVIHEDEPRFKTLPDSDESKETAKLAKLAARLASMSLK